MKHIALLLTVALVVSVAQAYPTYTIKETVAGSDVDLQTAGSLIQVDIDDATIDYADSTMTAPGDTPQVDGGASWVHDLGSYPPWGVYDRKMVVGVNGLTDLLPIADVGLIASAKLVIYRSSGWADGEVVNGYQLTTQWMWEAVGDSEGYDTGQDVYVGDDPDTGDPIYEDVIGGVSMAYTYDNGAVTAPWAAGGFSSADYTTANMGQFTTVGDGDNRYEMDITEIVKIWYGDSSTNCGLVLMLDENSGGDSNPYFRPSESTGTDSSRGDITTGLSFVIEVIPEPATLSLLAIGGIGALLRRKRS